MRLILTLVLTGILSAISTICFSQTWERTYYNHQYGSAVVQADDGGFIVTGKAWIGGVVFLKVDGYGDEVWSHVIDDESYEYEQGDDIIKTSDGGYMILAYTKLEVPDDQGVIWLIKADAEGIVEWDGNIVLGDHLYGTSIQQTSDGGYIIAAQYYYDGIDEAMLIKTDSGGNVIWNEVVEGLGTTTIESVREISTGGYIICGSSYEDVEYYSQMTLIKTDDLGTQQWVKYFLDDTDDTSDGASVRETIDGGFVIAGTTYLIFTKDWGYAHVYLVKTDSSGNEQWTQSISTLNSAEELCGAHDIEQTTDGGFILTGESDALIGTADSHVLILKTNSDGEQLWANYFDGLSTNSGAGYSIKQTSDEGFIITGFESSICLIKTNENGMVASINQTLENQSQDVDKVLLQVCNVLGQTVSPSPHQLLFYHYNDNSVEKRYISD